MTARITSGQKKQISRFLEDGLDGLELKKADAQHVIARGGELQTGFKRIVQELVEKGRHTAAAAVVEALLPQSITEAEVPAGLQPMLAAYRRLAIWHGVWANVPICWRVRAGFTLKTHAPQAGPCYKKFQYLQDWGVEDTPTTDSLVFWIPRLVPQSTNKTAAEQVALLAELRTRMELPAQHLSSFGSAALLAGLILAHFRATGERVPLGCYWARTDTLLHVGYRLNLGDFGEFGLRCDSWSWGGLRDDDLGVFPLGVEALGE